MRHLFTVRFLAIVLTSLLFQASHAVADDTSGNGQGQTLVFPASDMTRLADRGIEIPLAGKFTVKVWAPSNQAWSLASEGAKLTLTAKLEGDDVKPRWQTVGLAELPKDERIQLAQLLCTVLAPFDSANQPST